MFRRSRHTTLRTPGRRAAPLCLRSRPLHPASVAAAWAILTARGLPSGADEPLPLDELCRLEHLMGELSRLLGGDERSLDRGPRCPLDDRALLAGDGRLHQIGDFSDAAGGLER